jgi:hypothetical protein
VSIGNFGNLGEFSKEFGGRYSSKQLAVGGWGLAFGSKRLVVCVQWSATVNGSIIIY